MQTSIVLILLQAILISPGFFQTTLFVTWTTLPPHPPYAHISKDLAIEEWGDVRKVVMKTYEASLLQDPLMRLVLGTEANEKVKAQAEKLAREVEAFDSWSEDS